MLLILSNNDHYWNLTLTTNCVFVFIFQNVIIWLKQIIDHDILKQRYINLINVSNISKYNFQIYYVIENLCLYFILILNDCMTLKDNKWTDTLSSKTWRGGRKRRICAVGRMKVYEGRERRNATFKTGETTNAYCIVRDTTTVHGSSLNLLITEWNYIETFCE